MDSMMACSSSLLHTSWIASCSLSKSVAASAALSANVVVVGRGVLLAKTFFPSFTMTGMQQLKLQQQKRGLRSMLLSTAIVDGAVALEVATEEKIGEEVPIELQYPAFHDILPHRFPLLLVERVIEYNLGVSLVAIKNIAINDNFFPCHFLERPIMPGVLMVEAMAQVGGFVMLTPV